VSRRGAHWAGGQLPRPSTTRFVLLVLMVCAGTSFAAYWWFVALRGDWVTEQAACLSRLGRTGSVAAFNSCIGSVVIRQEGVVLLGPVTIVVTGVLIAVASVPILLLIWGAVTSSSRVAGCFQACLGEVEVHRRPRLVTVRRGARGPARVFGIYPRYWVVADSILLRAASDGELRAVLDHELAHLVAGDVDRARLARSIWGVFFVLVAPALVVSVAAAGGLAWVAVGLRLVILLALIHLTYQSLLRAREHEADLLAASAESSARAGPPVPFLAAALRSQPPPRWHGLPVADFLLAHPAPARRVAVLAQPRQAARLSVIEFLSIGLAAGVVFQELAFAVGAILPSSQQAAYWITGAIVAVPVSLVTITALWRHELAGPGPVGMPAAAAAGALLGAGLLAGSQLSPRAATNWGTVQFTVSPVLPSNLSLWAAGIGQTAALAGVAIVGGALFTLWALTLARLLTARRRRGSLTQWRRLSTVLAIAVLAIPIGTWFQVCRLTADVVIGPLGTPFGDLLQGRTLLVGLVVTVVIALLPVVALAFVRPARRRRRIWLTAGAWSAAAILVPVMPWVAGDAVHGAVAPGPPIAAGPASPAGPLPLLPPQVTHGHQRIGAGVMCFTLALISARDRTRPVIWREFGALLQRTPDQGLDTIGGALVRASGTPSDAASGLARQAWLAAGYRCNILINTPSPGQSP
jgi:hypothetical protein